MHRVCFVSPLARPVLEPNFQCDFGGAEVRAVNFATGLASDSQFDISMVLRSYRKEKSRRIGNLTAHFEPIASPIVRTKDIKRDRYFAWNLLKTKCQKFARSIQKRRQFEQPRDAHALPLLTELPADVLCCFGVNTYSANVIESAKQSSKQTLLFIAHDQDLDCEGKYKAIAEAYGGDVRVYRRVVESADRIVVQTPRQQSLLQEKFGRDARVIRNPIDLTNRVETNSSGGNYILWVGRADTFFKRADKMLQLAAMCPEIPFVAIMNKRNERVFDQLIASATSNVRIVSHVPYHEIEDYYANATALLSTSEGEGFPNAFLQAGKYGQPILSLNVDPGEMISAHQCGLLSHGNMDAMATMLTDLWRDRDSARRTELSDNIRRYVQDFHASDARINELADEIRMTNSSDQLKAA